MNEQTWDSRLQRIGGNILQSWRWGEFKTLQGWRVRRLSETGTDGTWMAQILFRRHGPVCIGYIPCGPTMCGDHERLYPRMMEAIDDACAGERALTLIMEPNQRFQLSGSYKQHGLVRWHPPFQPRLTMTVPIADDATMLQRMHHKTRYHIRHAQRNEVVIVARQPTPVTLAAFHALHAETTARNNLTTLPLAYFSDLIRAFDDHAEIFFASFEGEPATAVILIRYGDEANYLFAASSQRSRGQSGGASIVYRSLQWAREHGCRELDLGNISSQGLRDFKIGFGGEAREFPAAMERRYHPFLSLPVRHYLRRQVV